MCVPFLTSERHYPGRDVYELCAAVTAAGGQFLFHANGTSMSPHLPDGTDVVLSAISMAPPLGAIVLGIVNGKVVLHRILWSWSGRVLLAGDANGYTDGWIAQHDLAGIVVKWQRATTVTHITPRSHLRGWLVAIMRHGRRKFVNKR